jgi:hypothetical protein
VGKQPDFSDSERARLQALAEEQSHMEWLKARRKSRIEAVRGWVTWITAAWMLKDLLWRDAGEWLKALWK